MIAFLVFPVALVAVLFLWRRARRRKAVAPTPLAGIDTGTRSPFRTPSGRLFAPRRGF